MDNSKRCITIFTADKIYSGHIDIPNESFRTIDIFNSANTYWKDPSEKSFDDSLLLYEAHVSLDGNTRLGDYDKLQLKLSDVHFFYDLMESMGDDREKARAATMIAKTNEQSSKVQLFTHASGNSFYYITGLFYGLFKSKSKSRYIPVTDPMVTEVVRTGETWKKKKVAVKSSFLGIAIEHIEACSFVG